MNKSSEIQDYSNSINEHENSQKCEKCSFILEDGRCPVSDRHSDFFEKIYTIGIYYSLEDISNFSINDNRKNLSNHIRYLKKWKKYGEKLGKAMVYLV